MKICISARGKYVVLLDGFISAIFDNLVNAVAYVRSLGRIPEYTWTEEY